MRMAHGMSGLSRDEFTRIALGALSELYNAARRLTGNEHDAEDLVQETYLQPFARRISFEVSRAARYGFSGSCAIVSSPFIAPAKRAPNWSSWREAWKRRPWWWKPPYTGFE